MRKILFSIFFFIAGVAIASPAFALTVSPARMEITGDPGAVVRGEIELLNEQEGTRTFYTSAENFEPSGTSGAPNFIGAKDGLATWIQIKDTVVLESQGRAIVPFSISIPKNTDPGGYFAAIFFGSQPPGDRTGGQVSVGGKVGVLMLLRVTGDIAEGGGLIEFSANDRQRLFSSLPITLTFRINNTGGDRIVPIGEIRIKNTLGFTTETLAANKGGGSVLPGSARKFEVVWGESEASDQKQNDGGAGFFASVQRQWNDFHFGWYTGKLNVEWGASMQAARSSYHFFIFPWQLLSIILVLILAIGYIGSRGLRRYNRWIIAQARLQK